ncbi:MAG TPA: M14 family metallopeptidase [Candidatus Dormibacteraeota bacterium]|nr:M14 family metallopeptidase [Candidatus Dormibacteraeota bacterium]
MASGPGGRNALAAVCAMALLAAGPIQSQPKKTAPAGDWHTPAEISDYATTPRDAETIAYARRLQAAAPGQVRLETFGRSGEGRDLFILVVSKDGVFDPAAIHKAGRPIVLVQNAIHAGEMDGKDASLALLRDIVVTKEKAALIDRAVLVVIPIYNVDGHERFGPHNRINQNGPRETGWRTQARNLNLNRDYMKADAPETRAFLRLWARWLPDLFVDTHVTDGADFQYDTTYSVDTGPDVFPALAAWKRDVLAPYLEKVVGEAGHVISPYINLKSDTDPSEGITTAQDQPRFSTGYINLQNRPAVLLETHMLKDYRTRVLGSYEFLRALIQIANRDAGTIVEMNRAADAATIAAGRLYDPAARVPLRLQPDGTTEPFTFRGFKSRTTSSDVSGAARIEYTREPVEMTVPREIGLKVTVETAPPRAYFVPAQWKGVIDVLRAHGLRLQTTERAWEGEVETYRCDGAVWNEKPFEGHQVLFSPGEGGARPGATPGECILVHARLPFPAGSVIVPLDQRAGRVAVHLLEPQAPDSLLAWGFFNAIFERKEYAEPYVMESLARDMLAKDPKLREEFERRLAQDKAFAASPEARLEFFYRHSPWWDPRLGLYPVGRLAGLEGLPERRDIR